MNACCLLSIDGSLIRILFKHDHLSNILNILSSHFASFNKYTFSLIARISKLNYVCSLTAKRELMEVNSTCISDFQNGVLSIVFLQNRCLFALLDNTLKVILMCFSWNFQNLNSFDSLIDLEVLKALRETGILLTFSQKFNLVWLSCCKH